VAIGLPLMSTEGYVYIEVIILIPS